MKSGYIKCSSAKIYYEIHGEGEAIVFLHGNGEDSTYFKPQLERFSKEYKLIFIDSRGHGKSSFGTEKLSLNLMAKDVLKVLDALGLEKVSILGFSDGGNIALTLAISNPERIKSLIVMGANLKPHDMKFVERVPVNIMYYSYKILSMKQEKMQVLGLMVNEPNIEVSDLKKIHMPTLVIAGEKDAIKEECTKLISKSIKNSELKIIKDGDHFLSSKMPKMFNNIFHDFIHRNI